MEQSQHCTSSERKCSKETHSVHFECIVCFLCVPVRFVWRSISKGLFLLMHRVPLHTDSSSSSITSAVAQRPELLWNWFSTESVSTPTSHTDNKGAIINCLCHTFVILMSKSRQRQRYHSRVQPAHPSIHTHLIRETHFNLVNFSFCHDN